MKFHSTAENKSVQGILLTRVKTHEHLLKFIRERLKIEEIFIFLYLFICLFPNILRRIPFKVRAILAKIIY